MWKPIPSFASLHFPRQASIVGKKKTYTKQTNKKSIINKNTKIVPPIFSLAPLRGVLRETVFEGRIGSAHMLNTGRETFGSCLFLLHSWIRCTFNKYKLKLTDIGIGNTHTQTHILLREKTPFLTYNTRATFKTKVWHNHLIDFNN